MNSVWYGSSDTCQMASLESFKGFLFFLVVNRNSLISPLLSGEFSFFLTLPLMIQLSPNFTKLCFAYLCVSISQNDLRSPATEQANDVVKILSSYQQSIECNGTPLYHWGDVVVLELIYTFSLAQELDLVFDNLNKGYSRINQVWKFTQIIVW